MTMYRHEWALDLTLRVPFASTGVENAALGIDKSLLRNERGEIVLSGHQIRGLFRHFLIAVRMAENEAGIKDTGRLVRPEWFFNWFGRPGIQYGARTGDPEIYGLLGEEGEKPAQAGDHDLGRGRLTIRDLVLQDTSRQSRNRTRIRVDAERKSVKAGMLMVREQHLRTGDEAVFSSSHPGDGSYPAVILYAGEEECAVFEQAFRLFMENLPEIGAMKAAGYGEVTGHVLRDHEKKKLAIPARGTPGDDFAIVMKFSDPLLVEPSLASGNVQESASSISGAVIKAAIAEYGKLADPGFDDEFADVLSHMIIRFARPAEAGSSVRSRAIPFSLVKTGGGMKDFFATKSDEAVTFQSDFKEPAWLEAKKKYGIHDVRWISQTRTAIELGEQFAAENQLFNYRLAGVEDTVWIAQIVLPASMPDKDKEKARRLIAFLDEGVIQTGKMRSDLLFATAEEGAADTDASRSGSGWRITLQTPAALFGADESSLAALRWDIRAAYVKYFRNTLGASAASCIDWDAFDFLVQHNLAGGHRVTRARRAAGQSYYPFVLTEAGSVFILPMKDGAGAEDLTSRMAELARTGLPAAVPDWRENPFVPENGYGEVRIDDVDTKMAD